MHGNDFAWVGSAKRHFFSGAGPIFKDRHEERFAHEQPFARAHQGTEKTAVLLRAVAENGLHLDAILHVHHGAGCGDHRLLRVQFDLHELHVVAVDLVINFVHRCHSCS